MTIFELVLDFYHHPSRHESLLDPAECLPEGIDMLLGMSVNDSLREASMFAETPEEFHNAVAFFIENVMFAEGADYYRQLGLKPGSSLPQIRRNYELLSRFYYPGKEGGCVLWVNYMPCVSTVLIMRCGISAC